ncbi:delta-class carbonic anhydrase [Candidatus Electronema sp. JM]|uniref:delta-class carbonic anhydrase n=1 Tax=Candidatus Electronema sp. JM TaxID=3401571 RepID=UPI003AA854B6
MKRIIPSYIVAALAVVGLSSCVGINKGDSKEKSPAPPTVDCKSAGPQTPRDIDSKEGKSKVFFPVAPSYRELNLCNVHFHVNAEHKAKDFSLYAGEGEDGHGGGYKCNDTASLRPEELKPLKGEVCNGLKPGDTIEVHWVHSSCDVKPGKGLGSCLAESCKDPKLRVETQVFLVVNDPTAVNFNDLNYSGGLIGGKHQAKSLPDNTGIPVEFLGSTTGPSYHDQVCSPLQVTWSVRPQCAKLDINSLGEWCKNNVFQEEHGHGVRKLVTDPNLLSEIK